MYSYFYQDHGSAKKLILKGENGVSLTILPMLGGNIQKTWLPINNQLIQVTDGYDDEDDLLQLKQSKGIKMLPFPNRIKNGKYTFDDKEYSLTINKPNEQNAIHGLMTRALCDVAFIDCNDHRALSTLRYAYNQEYNAYPFNFLVEITYILSMDGVQVETVIKNTGSEKMPVGDGWHPYFCINKKKIDELYLQIPSKKYLEVDKYMIPTGEILKEKTYSDLALIGDATLDHCFMVETKEEIAETILEDKDLKVKLTVWQQSGAGKYNYVQLYTPKERNSIAIEPMTCAPNAFNNQIGLKVLNPDETMAIRFGYHLSEL